MDPLGKQPEVEFLILADRAEAINGKLYMMGGGWDRLAVVDFAAPISISLAASVLVPWHATNIEHHLSIHIEHEDGTVLEPQIDAGVNMERPPQAIPGQPFRAIIAVNGTWKFPGPGAYRIMAGIGEGARRDYPFHVFDANPGRSY